MRKHTKISSFFLAALLASSYVTTGSSLSGEGFLILAAQAQCGPAGCNISNNAAAHGRQQNDDDKQNSGCPDGSCGSGAGGGGGCSGGSCGGGAGGSRGGGGGGALGGMLKKVGPMMLPLLMAMLMSGNKNKDEPPADLNGTPTPVPTAQPTATAVPTVAPTSTPAPHPTECPSPTFNPGGPCDLFGCGTKPPTIPDTLPTPPSFSKSDPRSFFPGMDFKKM